MAFVLERLGKTSVTAAKAPLLWTYEAGTDNEATYIQDGYFDGAYPSIGKGHLIYVNSNSGFSILRVTNSGPSAPKITVLPILNKVIVNGRMTVPGNNQSTFTIDAPGAKIGDTAFVQVFSDTLSPVVRVQAITDQIFFQTADIQPVNFEINYAVLR